MEDLQSLYLALSESAKNDNIAKNFGINPVHGDGWGYVIYNRQTIYTYKTEKPIFSDSISIPTITGEFLAIFHARQASDKTTVSSIFSHPFFGSDQRYLYFFAHNGHISEESLMKELNFSGKTTDSEMALQYITRKGLEKALPELERMTLSALNILILRIDKSNGNAEVFYENYYLNKERSEYYDMFEVKLSKGNAVVSSTLTQRFNEKQKVDFGKLEQL
ncbi:class II glutamine amidotransferase [Candidatus Acidianus copahuensis]|nr:class II glutamine amidotransferase [Candidatus Acidianus copahuensis]